MTEGEKGEVDSGSAGELDSGSAEQVNTVKTADTVANDFAGGEAKIYDGAEQPLAELGKTETDDRSIIVDDEAQYILGKHLSHVATTPLTKKQQRRTLWKIDLRVTLPMFMTIMVIYYDKSMVGQSAIWGMVEDLHLYKISNGEILLTPYQNAVTIYFVGGIVSMYPMTMVAQKFEARYVLVFCILSFGIVQLCSAAIQNFGGIMATKFLLGFFAEPVFAIFLAQTPSWYTQAEQVWRLGLWYSAASVSVTMVAAVDLACTYIGGSLETWRWFYIMAGIFSFSWGLLTIFLAPDHPTRVKWLTDSQRFWAIDRLKINNQGIINRKLKRDQVKETFLSFEFWLMFIMILAVFVVNGGVNSFGALIAESLGFTKRKALCYIMAAGFSGTVAIQVSACIARFVPNTRLIVSAFISLIPIAGATMLWKTPLDEQTQLLFGFWLVCTYGGAGLQIVALMASNVAGSTKRTLYGSGAAIASALGNLTGPYLFQEDQKPHYPLGYNSIMFCMSLNIVGCIILYIYWRLENRRRNKLYGKPKTKEAFSDMTDKQNRDFRYQL